MILFSYILGVEEIINNLQHEDKVIGNGQQIALAMDCYNHLQNRLTTLSNGYRLSASSDGNNSNNSNANNHNATINNFDNMKKINDGNSINNNPHIEHNYNDIEYNKSLKFKDSCVNRLRMVGKNLYGMCNSVSCSEINFDNDAATT